MNKRYSSKIILLLIFLACQIGFAGFVSKWPKAAIPLPLKYAKAAQKEHDLEKNWQLFKKFLSKGDGLIIMRPNTDYALFHVAENKQFFIKKIEKDSLYIALPKLVEDYQRLWIWLNDPVKKDKAQIPNRYKLFTDQYFLRLPSTIPIYLYDRTLQSNPTNSWQINTAFIENYIQRDQDLITPDLMLKLANLYRKNGKLDLAIQKYKFALELFPKNALLQRALGETYYWDCHPAQYELSIEHNLLANYYQQKQTGKPMHTALFNTAMAYAKLQQIPETIIQYNFILDKLNSFPEDKLESKVRRYLARLYLEIGKTNEAITQLEADIRLDAQEPNYSYDLMLASLGKNGEIKRYKNISETYFELEDTIKPVAIRRHISFMLEHATEAEIKQVINQTLNYMVENQSIQSALRENSAWWQSWTNATISRGILPVKSK